MNGNIEEKNEFICTTENEFHEFHHNDLQDDCNVKLKIVGSYHYQVTHDRQVPLCFVKLIDDAIPPAAQTTLGNLHPVISNCLVEIGTTDADMANERTTMVPRLLPGNSLASCIVSSTADIQKHAKYLLKLATFLTKLKKNFRLFAKNLLKISPTCSTCKTHKIISDIYKHR